MQPEKDNNELRAQIEQLQLLLAQQQDKHGREIAQLRHQLASQRDASSFHRVEDDD
jgi:hypothetical protein